MGVYDGSGDMSHQYDARFTGYKLLLNGKRLMIDGKPVRSWNRITVFTTGDRNDAIKLAVAEASKYGYDEVTIDHITKIG